MSDVQSEDDGRNPDLSHRSDLTHDEAAEAGPPVIQEIPKDDNA